ncbi:MAG: O-antigen ligase family protein [Candidatus Moranbacteria bacterium]|nr:O-antigen ligase family protein [Candidatus Moranbacteria bacterium]
MTGEKERHTPKSRVQEKTHKAVITVGVCVAMAGIFFPAWYQPSWLFFATFILMGAVSVWRYPWIALLLFIASLPHEIVSMTPTEGLSFRPYQAMAVLLAVQIVQWFLIDKMAMKKIKRHLTWLDLLPALFAVGAVVASIVGDMSAKENVKDMLIALSFPFLYYTTRLILIQQEEKQKDGKEERKEKILTAVVAVMVVSAVVSVIIGVAQNILFQSGAESFATMPGRANAFFSEPNWLGTFLSLAVAIIVIGLWDSLNKKDEIKKTIVYSGVLTILMVGLLITVTRSAWLAVGGACAWLAVLILFSTIKNKKSKIISIKDLAKTATIVTLSTALAVILVLQTPLTSFDLFGRATSTAGYQTITVSCEKPTELPRQIKEVGDLTQYNCRHINLEEIQEEKNLGKFVTRVDRSDPSINVRKGIYQETVDVLKEKWLTGVGWGNSSAIFGTDSRGAALNASNIFLETWVSGGFVSVIAIILLFIVIAIRSTKNFFSAKSVSEKMIGLGVSISVIAILVPNMFNAGIFLGFMWALFAVWVWLVEKPENKE